MLMTDLLALVQGKIESRPDSIINFFVDFNPNFNLISKEINRFFVTYNPTSPPRGLDILATKGWQMTKKQLKHLTGFNLSEEEWVDYGSYRFIRCRKQANKTIFFCCKTEVLSAKSFYWAAGEDIASQSSLEPEYNQDRLQDLELREKEKENSLLDSFSGDSYEDIKVLFRSI